ncbi:MAG TPA: DNA polymerase IV [Bacillota bacterium]|nr:DNA polymerase IV [Bacillota bacterium]
MSRWYPKKGRVILHIDMNAFYASVEVAHDPSLKGKPLAIAGNPHERKGIIVTSSYEARAKGVKTTMPLWQARRLCPNLIALPPNFAKYREASRQIFKRLAEVTPMIQPVSIDEGYMDITDCAHLGTPLDIAHNIQQRLLNELDLPCSIGIGPNKFLAKMASDMKKPLGITVLRIRDVQEKLWPLPVIEMFGIGEKTAEKLNTIDIHTIGDLAKADEYQLAQLLGINGERLKSRANGIDHREVDPDAVHEFKSIGSSKTLPYDTTDENKLKSLFADLSRKIERRLNRRELAGLSVQITIRFYDRETITRSKKLNQYISKYEDIYSHALQLFHENWNGKPIRLLGVTVQDIEERENIAEQLSLFTYQEKINEEKFANLKEKLSEKYGDDIITPTEKESEEEEQFSPGTSFQKDFLDDYKRG